MQTVPVPRGVDTDAPPVGDDPQLLEKPSTNNETCSMVEGSVSDASPSVASVITSELDAES
jgi:hypothetical protein